MRKVVLLVLIVALVASVEARFAAQTGFSGRDGDCLSCHAQSGPVAQAHLDGLPAHWVGGQTYLLDIVVTGGPPAAPSPQPQGGFELEVEAGTLAPGPGMEDLLRVPMPNVATYEPEGTLRRDWQVAWTAPDGPPVPLGIWLAVVSANGNHVIATNTSDGGQTGDAAASLHVIIPPDPVAEAAWLARPMAAPTIDAIEVRGQGWRIEGHHQDPDATHLGVFDGRQWTSQATDTAWSVLVTGDLGAIELRSEGHGRASPTIGPAPGKDASFAGVVPIIALAVAFGVLPTTRKG